jgi:hypothetical protein
MDEQSSVVPEDDPPLVLRKVPPQRHRLARSMIAQGTATAGGIWWELVDAAAAPELPAVAVALTHNDVRGCVTVSALGARHADAGVCGATPRAGGCPSEPRSGCSDHPHC